MAEEFKGDAPDAPAAAPAAGGDGLATSGRWWVTAPNAIAPERPSAPGDKSGRLTVMEVFRRTVRMYGNKPALNWMELEDGLAGAALDKAIGNGTWHSWNWRQYYDQCMAFARSLVAIDFKPFATVNILGFNHRNWLVADLGVIAAGGMAAGIYTTNTKEAVAYIVDHSECQVAVVENRMQMEKFNDLLDTNLAANLKAIVVYDEAVDEALKAEMEAKRPGFKIYGWDEFMGLGSGEDIAMYKARVEARIAAQLPGHCCTLIYTSGTTGPPKAVMVSHDNVTWTANEVLAKSFSISPDDRMVSYLPLSHIAAQMLDVHGPMAGGSAVYFSTVSAFKGQLKAWLNAAQPTVFFGVPRVWEKMEAAIKAIGAKSQLTGTKAKLVAWAKRAGAAMSDSIQYGRNGRQPFMYGLAYKLVLSKIHAAIGLGHARILATGAAPIGKATLAYFASLGMPIYEVFGQSECTGPQTVNYPDPDGFSGMYKLASAGPPVNGSIMAVVPDPANAPLKRRAIGEGEIVYSGRHIMMGYMKNPKKTREAIDPDGFLHSGDKGLIDKDGFLKITGRYKELIIGAGGENIAPVLIEQTFKEQCPAISNFVVYGDYQKFLVALVTLQCVEDPETRRPTDNLAPITVEFGAKLGSAATTASGATATEEERARWMAGLEQVRKAANAAAVSKASHVQYVHILTKDFEVGDELTDTMKLKRAVVYSKYMDDIKAMYNAHGGFREAE